MLLHGLSPESLTMRLAYPAPQADGAGEPVRVITDPEEADAYMGR